MCRLGSWGRRMSHPGRSPPVPTGGRIHVPWRGRRPSTLPASAGEAAPRVQEQGLSRGRFPIGWGQVQGVGRAADALGRHRPLRHLLLDLGFRGARPPGDGAQVGGAARFPEERHPLPGACPPIWRDSGMGRVTWKVG